LAKFWPEPGRINPNNSQLGTGTVLELTKARAQFHQAIWMQPAVSDGNGVQQHELS